MEEALPRDPTDREGPHGGVDLAIVPEDVPVGGGTERRAGLADVPLERGHLGTAEGTPCAELGVDRGQLLATAQELVHLDAAGVTSASENVQCARH
jgi:hypothetical protein